MAVGWSCTYSITENRDSCENGCVWINVLLCERVCECVYQETMLDIKDTITSSY